jgi:hypothetical protein
MGLLGVWCPQIYRIAAGLQLELVLCQAFPHPGHFVPTPGAIQNVVSLKPGGGSFVRFSRARRPGEPSWPDMMRPNVSEVVIASRRLRRAEESVALPIAPIVVRDWYIHPDSKIIPDPNLALCALHIFQAGVHKILFRGVCRR